VSIGRKKRRRREMRCGQGRCREGGNGFFMEFSRRGGIHLLVFCFLTGAVELIVKDGP
jgi:hypothetical protein